MPGLVLSAHERVWRRHRTDRWSHSPARRQVGVTCDGHSKNDVDHPFEVIDIQLYEFINKYLFDLEGLYRRSKGLTVTGKDGTPVLAFFAPPKSSPPFPILELSKGGDTIQDKFPVTQGPLLALPRRHTPDLFGMVERERIDANNLLRILNTRIRVRLTNPILQGLVAFPGGKVRLPGDANEDSHRETKRSGQGTILAAYDRRPCPLRPIRPSLLST